jgi:hypothetical protein
MERKEMEDNEIRFEQESKRKKEVSLKIKKTISEQDIEFHNINGIFI